MPNPLGYLSENAARQYPFKESNLLTSTSGFVLPDDFLVDALVVLYSLTAAKVCLTSLRREVKELESSVTWVTVFKFAVYSRSNIFIEEVEFEIDGNSTTLSAFDSFSQAYANLDIKLVIGAGFLTLLPSFAYEFDGYPDSAAALDDATVIPAMPTVNEVVFQNYTSTGIDTVATVAATEVKLQGGTNVVLEDVDEQIEASVIAGRGAGLFDPCAEVTGVKKINNVSPNTNGNISLIGANCFDVLPATNALQLEHLCDPKCTPEQIAAYAHYINRLKDALVIVSAYAEAARQQLIDSMTAYAARISQLSALEAPFVEVEEMTTRNPQKIYNSFAVGVYNPGRSGNTTPLNTSLTVTPESGAGFIYVPNTAYVQEDSIVQHLPSYGFSSRAIPCRSMLEHGFVLYNQNLQITNKHVEFFLTQTGAAHNATAYKMQVLHPTAAYFTLKYRKIWTGTQYHYKYTINLYDKSITETSTRTASLIINFPTGGSMQIIEGTLSVDRNKVKTTHTTPNSRRVSLQSLSVDFAHKAEVTFEATSDPGTFAMTINLMVLSVPSSFSRTILVA